MAEIFLIAFTAFSISFSLLKYEKLNLTAPCSWVPKALCIRGAQCPPALVIMLCSILSISHISAESISPILIETIGNLSILSFLLLKKVPYIFIFLIFRIYFIKCLFIYFFIAF